MDRGTDVERALRSAGLRVTVQRVAVLGAVTAHPHSDTGSIIELARRAVPELSHQAVYDALRVLTGAGVLRCIEPAGTVARYEARTGDNHHHLVCRSCGVIVDVDCATGHAPCLTPADGQGFLVDEAEVVYWGRCLSCVSVSPASADC